MTDERMNMIHGILAENNFVCENSSPLRKFELPLQCDEWVSDFHGIYCAVAIINTEYS